jgi:energy-coupling factor transporter ATP-binding protein EcfA2
MTSLKTLAVANYRSIRSLVVPLGDLTLVTGANGSGKSNLYRALRILSEAAQGGIVASLAKEGGLASNLWAGPEQISRRMKSGEIPIQGGPRTQVVACLREFLPANARAVQCTLFAKTSESNWLVSLHQDLSIPVAERVESPGCSGWCQKQGDTFVQPPISVLESLVAVRLHLDDCDERNGALRVVPGSHRLGRLSSREREARGEHLVSVPKGGAMIMRPLLLHASSKSSVGLPRRVLHFVYGPAVLPEGLRWPSHRQSLPNISQGSDSTAGTPRVY